MIGYTGAFGWNLPPDAAIRFWTCFSDWATDHNVVSSFARLSLFSGDLVPFDGRIRVVQPNVVRDLEMSDEHLWRDVEHKVRKNVKRARSEAVTVEADPDCERLDVFMDIYAETMKRRRAQSRYFFDRDFYVNLVAALGRSVQLYLARMGTKEVAAEIVLTSTHHSYSFLGGTRESAFESRPNDLLKYEIIRSLRNQGFCHYVLGGGPSPEDGVFRYKRSFAPAGIVDFKVGEKIHNPEAYESLVRRRAAQANEQGATWEPNPSFFPAYRSCSVSPACVDLAPYEGLRPHQPISKT
jgi:lipid II:glycine glycyltransferase (peptidoglycan interpeptide bridge formation enzyme)